MRINKLLTNAINKTENHAIYCLLLLVLSSLFFLPNAVAQSAKAVMKSISTDKDNEIKKLLQYYDKQIYFSENKGQWPVNVLYKADFPLGQAIATKEGMMVGTFDPASVAARSMDMMQEEKTRKKGQSYKLSNRSVKGHGWLMNFVNSSPSMRVETTGKHADFYNYLTGGDDSKHAMNVSNYQEIWYKNVYDKVDVRYYPSKTGTLEYDIVCKPGFDKKNISLKLDGIDKISLKENGHLNLQTSVGEMEYPAPVAYQQINGKRKTIQAKYKLTGDNEFTFVLGKFNTSQPLIIDPIALRWATWITNNSTGNDHAHCVWVHPSDTSIYIACRIQGSGLITTNAFDNSANGSTDVVLGKYKQPGTVGGSGQRIWQTYLGGGQDDNPLAMEEGPDGNMYVTGWTGSPNFPMSGGTGGAFTGEAAGIDDRAQGTAGNDPQDNVFIVKFNQAGNSFKSAVIGGNKSDQPFDIRITPHGDIYVCGASYSTNLGTVVGQGAVNVPASDSSDVFVFKINSQLSSIYWFKNYLGSGLDEGNIMLTDPTTGNVYVAGQTESPNFPVTDNARQSTMTGAEDGFIQKLDSNGNIIWSSFFNAAANDSMEIGCMEFNTTHDKLYFGGVTSGLNKSNIPHAETVWDTTYNGAADFFVALMDTAQNLIKTTYLGGKATEVNMMGLNVDLNNDVYIFGYSNSPDFPVSKDALDTVLNNGGTIAANHDETFTKLSSDLNSIIYSTFYGGVQDDYDPQGERGIKFSDCRIYTLVTAISNDIPLTQGAITTNKLSNASQANGIYEPGLLVWANPPDLTSNTISGSQKVCAGVPLGNLTGSMPSYSLPNIIRNGTSSPYPVNYNAVVAFTWQYSTDSVVWHDVPGGNAQNLAGSLIPVTSDTTYIRRLINGDACIGVGISDQIVTLLKIALPATIHNVTCYGLNNGSIAVSPANGISPYSYLWSTGATTSSITGLPSGTYKIKVTDATGCNSDTTSFTVTQPSAPLSATASSVTDTCNKNHGTASVIASGGTTPYYYSWSTTATTSSISSLSQNTYTVTVTDTNQCSFTTQVTVGNISGPTVGISPTGPSPVCQGDSIQLCASGADTYSWSNGATTSCIYVGAGLTGGFSYGFSVIGTASSTQCVGGDETSVNVNSPPAVTIAPSGSISFCQGDSAQLCVSGAVTYNWSLGGQTSSCIYVNANGTYSVVGTDGNGCSDSTSVNVKVNNNTSGDTSAVACNSFTWYGALYTSSTPSPTHVFKGGNSNGCDSTVTLNLIINSTATPTIQVNNFCGYSVLTSTATGTLLWSTGETTTSITVTQASTYSLTATANNCPSSPGTGTSAPLNIPSAPSVNVSNNCGSSVLSTTAIGVLLWSNGQTTSSITVTDAATYSVTQTVNTCTSAPGTGTSAPLSIPSAPSVNVSNSCGSSVLSTTATGALLWSNGQTTSSITVTDAATYSITQTVNTCTSGSGTGTSAPISIPSAPSVNDADNCGYSVLSTTATGALLWSNGQTTSSITVTSAGTYSVTQTVNTCTSAPGSNTANPSNGPSAPSVNVSNNCGSSVLSTTATGALLWSNGQTTSSITVTDAATYSVTQTVNSCISAPGTGTSSPLSIPSAPSVNVSNNCGSSVLSTLATGALLWSNGQTTSSITVTNAATYSVTQTVNTCTSAPGTGTSAPLGIPSAPSVNVSNNCGSSVLSTTATGALLWSNGQTNSSITVTDAATYSVTQTVNTCTSGSGTGTSAPISIPSAPSVNVSNNCGSSVLSTTATGALLWSKGQTTSSITVTNAATYSVTQTVNTCTSAPGTGTSAPLSIPSAPSVNVTNNCGSSILSTTATGVLLWSSGQTTSSITVTNAATYSVTQTVNTCTSGSGTGISAPINIPSAPSVSDADNCGYSVLSTTATGALLWSNGQTTSSITVTSAGTFSVTQTVNTCTSAPGSNTANPSNGPSAPSVNVSNNCGSSVLSTTATGTLLWSNGQTTSSITVTNAATYSVTQTVNSCTSAPGTGTSAPISIPSAPSVNVSNNCGSSVLSTTATGALLWSNGQTTTSITVTNAATYSVTQTVNTCTSAPGTGTSAPLSIPSAPSVNVSNNCGSSVLSTTATGALLWSNGQTTTSIIVTNTATYSVTQTVNTCTSAPGTGTSAPLSIPSAPSVNVSNNCGSSVLSTTATGALLWSNGQTTTSITVTNAATYSVTQTVNTCTSAPGTGTSALLSVPSTPAVIISNNCGSSVLSTTATGSLLWSNGQTTSSITVTNTATYSVTQTVSGCISGAGTAGSAPKTIPSQPGVNVANNCGSSTLTATGFTGTLSWSNGATTSSITVTNAATYSVTQTVNGCTSPAGTGTSAPKATPGTPGVTVSNNCGSSALTATGFTGTLVWSNGATTSAITVTNTITYSVTQTVNGCTSLAGTGTPAPKTVPPAPGVTVNNNCGNSVLTATGFTGSLVWSNQATTSSITVTIAGTYSVSQTVNGCISVQGSGTAAPGSGQPSCTISGPNSICSGQPASLCAPAGNTSYIWSTGATTSCITITQAGTYSLTVSNGPGCSCTSSKCVTANPAPSCNISVTTCQLNHQHCVCTLNHQHCNGPNCTLNHQHCVCYLNHVHCFFSETRCQEGHSHCTCYINHTHCTSVNCTLNHVHCQCSQNHQHCYSYSSQNSCSGNPLTLVATGGTSFKWSTGATTSSISVSTSGTYSVTVYNSSGCSSSCSIPVTIGTTPSCTISGSTAICSGQSTPLSAPSGAGLKYSWSTGATTSGITVSSSATYYVTVTNSSGCSSTCSKCVTVSSPNCNISTGCGGNVICNGQGTTLCGAGGCSSYYWSTGSRNQCISVNSSGTYSLTVTNNAGCISTCTKTITVGTIPSCTISGQTTICSGQTTQLCAPSGTGLSYSWSNGKNAQCITVGSSGTYYVTVSNSSGCSSTCSACVRVNSAPSCYITGNTCIKKGTYTTLCAPSGCSNYKWTNGCYTSSIYVCNSGTYCVTVSNSNGCTNTGTACVTYSSGRMNEDNASSNDNTINATAYPNPFNSTATIEFSNPTDASHTTVEVYALDGSKVATLFNEVTKGGIVYKVEFDAANLNEGVYIYRIISNENIINGRLILLRH